MIKRIILFLILNFSALALGGLFTTDGVSSAWYQTINKAPWTPPGWMFGAAWTLIMVCFSIYMAYLIVAKVNKRTVISLFIVQLILNMAWNPLFFYFQAVGLALICISLLTVLIAYLFFNFWKQLPYKTLFLAPYLLWLLIATSLNFYIFLYN
jgi:tryptophan-rich sensory protein